MANGNQPAVRALTRLILPTPLMRHSILLGILLFTASALPDSARGDVTLPTIFSEHMVLKKARGVPVWGKAAPGEDVTVSLGGQMGSAQADAAGAWKTVLDLSKSEAGPFIMTVKGRNEIAIPDVLVGEVWIASGQSNMEWPLAETVDGAAELAKLPNPRIRMFQPDNRTSEHPTSEMSGRWFTPAPDSGGRFSAVGYYFAKTLAAKIRRPVGIVICTWGGTPVEAWMSPEAIASVPVIQESFKKRIDHARDFPELRKAFTGSFRDWLIATGRSDRKNQAFIDDKEAGKGWNEIAVPAKLTNSDGSPFFGALWLRREFAAKTPGTSFRIDTAPLEGFEAFYWNGKLIEENGYDTVEGTGANRYYSIPGEDVKATGNVALMRIYAPAVQPFVPWNFTHDNLIPESPVTTKVEFVLPPPPPAQAPPLLPEIPFADQLMATYLYNSLIFPLIPYAISGVIWYQGENNTGRSYQYRETFPLLITDWRRQWGQGDFPFYFAQLANFLDKENQPGESGWAELREAQSMTLRLPHTGQAVIIDAGEADDIHPRNKKIVGQRLARIALAKDYHQESLVFSGPVYRSMKIEEAAIRLSFDQSGGGLTAMPLPSTYVKRSLFQTTAPLHRSSPASELEGFAICGEDRKWHWANARIEGTDVLVWSDEVREPVAVRYAWANNPTGNLANKEGLPASPFRTDDFPAVTRAGTY